MFVFRLIKKVGKKLEELKKRERKLMISKSFNY
jgi:hypothetical protein